MTELLVVFLVGFASVFVAGFQSRAVNHGNYGWAAGNSFLLGIGNASIWTHITAPEMGWAGWIVYGFSGSLAITASMYVHERYIRDRSKKQ